MKVVLGVIGLLVLIILFSGCPQDQPDAGDGTDDGQDFTGSALEDCLSESNLNLQAECIKTIVKSNSDPSLCEEIINATGKSHSCYSELALNLKDVSYCNEVTDMSSRYWCISEAIYGTTRQFRRSAEGSRNPEDCFKLLDEEDQSDCLYVLATKLPQPDLCNQIPIQSNKEACLLKTGGVSDCGSLTGTTMNQCYKDKAIAEKDVSICQNIDNSVRPGPGATVEFCITEIAKELDDESLCELAANVEQKHEFRDSCYLYFARERNDPSLCNKLSGLAGDYYSKDSCMLTIATSLGDSSSCANLEEQNLRDQCYYTFASKEQNAETCGDIVDADFKLVCQAGVLNDVDKCSEISSADYKDGCYFNYSLKNKNGETCESIQDSQTKDLCLQIASIASTG